MRKGKVLVWVLLVLSLFSLDLFSQQAQVTGTRNLPEFYGSPGTVNVSLDLEVDEANKPNGVIVKEYVPIGWNVVSSTPQYNNFDPQTGEIKWVFFGNDVNDNDMDIQYQLEVPEGEAGTKFFDGKILYNDPKGNPVEETIGGDTELPEIPPAPTYSISGRVTLQGGSTNVTEVVLTLSGDASDTTNPDAEGNYSFTGLAGGNYTVTPSLNKYRFEPPSRSYTSLNSDKTNQNFTGIYQCNLTVNSAHDTPTLTPPDNKGNWQGAGTFIYDRNTQITASVTSPAAQTNGTRYVCTGWTGTGSVPASGSNTGVTFTITDDSSITWNWKTQYYLDLTPDPSEGGTVEGDGWYDEGEDAQIHAIPNEGWAFTGWSGDYTGTDNPATITMDGPKNITAHFQPENRQLEIELDELNFGETEVIKDFTVRNIGTVGDLNWNATTSTPWITSINPDSGTLSPNQSQDVSVIINRDGLTPGHYTGKIDINSNGGSGKVDVYMDVPNTPPDKPQNISPSDGAVSVLLDPMLIASEFTDSDRNDTQTASEWQIFYSEQTETDTPVYHQQITLASIALNPSLSFNQIQVPWGTLKPNIEYKWRVRYKDTYGPDWSEWSNFTYFTTLLHDTDLDEQIPDETELSQLEDNYQVETGIKALNGQTVGLKTGKGTIKMVKNIDPDDLPEEGKPDNLPFGLFSTRIEGLTEGETTILTFYIPGNYEGGSWWKYDPVAGWYEYKDVTFNYDSETSYTRVDLTVEDGGNGDTDGEKNGTIVDPSGPTPPPPPSPSGGGGGGGCFIATAAFGSSLSKQVVILKQFRDKYLLTNKPGKAFVRWYYIHSPKTAEFIRKHIWAKIVVRIGLYPAVFISYLLVKLPLVIGFISLIIAVSIFVRIKRALCKT